MIEVAKSHVCALKQALVRAWFNPKISRSGKESWSHVVNKKGDTSQGHLSSLRFVEENFWKETETFFYQKLSEVVAIADHRERPLVVYKNWIEYLRGYSIRAFEFEAFLFNGEDRNIKRAVVAKKYLFSELWPKKGLLAELNALIKTL